MLWMDLLLICKYLGDVFNLLCICYLLFFSVVVMVNGFIVDFGLKIFVMVWLWKFLMFLWVWLFGLYDGWFISVKILLVLILIVMVFLEVVLYFVIVESNLW